MALINCQSVSDAQACINQLSFQTVLDLAGTLEQVKSLDNIDMIANGTTRLLLLGRVCSSLERLKDGLNVLGVFGAVYDNPEIFCPAFSYVSQTLTVNLFSSLFTSTFRSDEGSNAHAKESLVLFFWNYYLQDVEEHAVDVRLNDIMFFPPDARMYLLGFGMFLAFFHEPESNGLLSRYPKANTCASKLSIPVVHTTYDE